MVKKASKGGINSGNTFRTLKERKFIMDISQRMMNRLRSSEKYKDIYVGKYEITACVVFSFVRCDNRTHGEVYKVSLNWNSTSEATKYLSIPEHFEGCIEDVLEKAVSCLDQISLQALNIKQTEPSRHFSAAAFDNLNRLKNVGKEFNFLIAESFYEELFLCKRKPYIDPCFENMSADLFKICFESKNQATGFSLLSCGHWFCDACWEGYCKSHLQLGYPNISCPEVQCSEMVDYPILSTIFNVSEVLRLKRRVFESKPLSSLDSLWCPNPKCGRMIRLVVKLGKPQDVTCLCGYQFCCCCKKQSHWPLPCTYALHYWKKLRRRGDDNLKVNLALQTTVRGKSCPKCHMFIEKGTGCFSMQCVCGAHFCWGCLGLYPDNKYSTLCNQAKHGDLNGTTKINAVLLLKYDITAGRGVSVSFQLAVNHRNARHPSQISILRASCRQIMLKCKAKAKRKGPLFFEMFSENDVTEHSIKGNIDVVKQMRYLFSNIISIYLEYNHILEYSFILLEQLNKKNRECMPLRMTIDSFWNCANEIHDLLVCSNDISDVRLTLKSLVVIQKKAPNLIKQITKQTSVIENRFCVD